MQRARDPRGAEGRCGPPGVKAAVLPQAAQIASAKAVLSVYFIRAKQTLDVGAGSWAELPHNPGRALPCELPGTSAYTKCLPSPDQKS